MLAKLISKQTELGLADRGFAELLGIPRETWAALKAGRVKLDGRVAVKVARAIKRSFPDLVPDVMFLLMSDDTDTAAVA